MFSHSPPCWSALLLDCRSTGQNEIAAWLLQSRQVLRHWWCWRQQYNPERHADSYCVANISHSVCKSTELKLACRPLLARTLESLQSGWQHDPSLGKLLLTRLLQDLHSTVTDSVSVNAESHKRFLRLCSCIEAIFNGCRQKVAIDLSGKNCIPNCIPNMLHAS